MFLELQDLGKKMYSRFMINTLLFKYKYNLWFNVVTDFLLVGKSSHYYEIVGLAFSLLARLLAGSPCNQMPPYKS